LPAIVAGLRFPYTRVMMARTRLAYVHLRNLLSDAKRDRSARLSGYVAVWLPEEFVVLYLQDGEMVNATILDGESSRAVALGSALDRIPTEPEYGEICFHEAEDEQLASMFAAQTVAPDPWPKEMRDPDPSELFPFLTSIMFDGMVEVVSDNTVNYLRFKSGSVDQAFLSMAQVGTVAERVAKLFAPGGKGATGKFRRWPTIDPLPRQAPPALVQAYRELGNALCQRLVASGRDAAPAIAEQARRNLLKKHPALESFAVGKTPTREPIANTERLTAAVAAWLSELLWASADHGGGSPPEVLLRELTWDRRHMFQSAGFYDLMPWKVDVTTPRASSATVPVKSGGS
jgi:hypothetical protein